MMRHNNQNVSGKKIVIFILMFRCLLMFFLDYFVRNGCFYKVDKLRLLSFSWVSKKIFNEMLAMDNYSKKRLNNTYYDGQLLTFIYLLSKVPVYISLYFLSFLVTLQYIDSTITVHSLTRLNPAF